MSDHEYTPTSKAGKWFNDRLPLLTLANHLTDYPTPKNLNYWWTFGGILTFCLITQIVTGLTLAMHYIAHADMAFESVEHIMRDVNYGWLIRYIHANGASMFFLAVYIHIFRSLFYGSYKAPRELLWFVGMAIFLVLMAEGFFGYLLPWGNMSYRGAQVIVSLAGAVPVVGPDLVEWARGDFLMSEVALNRFFALHVVLLSLLLVALVFVHIVALHHVGSNNPDGIEIKKKKDNQGIPLDGIPFWPYSIVKDLFALSVFLFIFLAIVFFAPEMGGYFIEIPNFEKANPLKPPEHIAPVWYYTPFYSMLRAATFPLFGLDAKFWGLVVMAGAIALPFVLPWLDRSPVRSMRYKGRPSKVFLVLFVIAFFVLGYLVTVHPTPLKTLIAQVCTGIYFAYFLLMPWYTSVEMTKPVPDRVTTG